MSFNFNIVSLNDIAIAHSDIKLAHTQDASILTHVSRIAIYSNVVSKYDLELLKFCERILRDNIGDDNIQLIVQCILLSISRNIDKVNKITKIANVTTSKFFVINFPIKWHRNRFIRAMDKKFYEGIKNYTSLDSFVAYNFIDMLDYIKGESYSVARIHLMNMIKNDVKTSFMSRINEYFSNLILFESWDTIWRRKYKKK